MPSPEESLARRQFIEQLAEQKHAEQLSEIERAEMAHIGARLRALFENKEVQWFLEEFMRPLVTREHDIALDTKLSPVVRDIAAHRHVLAKEFHGLLAEMMLDHEARALPPADPPPQGG